MSPHMVVVVYLACLIVGLLVWVGLVEWRIARRKRRLARQPDLNVLVLNLGKTVSAEPIKKKRIS